MFHYFLLLPGLENYFEVQIQILLFQIVIDIMESKLHFVCIFYRFYSIRMGNNLCYDEKTRTFTNESARPHGHRQSQPVQDHIEATIIDQSQFEEGSTTITNFIAQHQHQKPITASNNLYFAMGNNPKFEKMMKKQQLMSTKPIAKKDHSQFKRCSINVSNIDEFQSTIKDYVVTQKNMHEGFGRIEISQQKFIQLRQEDIKKIYKFEEIVGEGSFGSVYRAVCIKSKEERAIKIIRKENLGQSQKKEVFAQLQLLKKMDHANIIKLYEVFQTKDRYQVVTQFCKGGSIIDFIKQRKYFDENAVKVILRQLLGCLNYLHTLRIVHRDVKLENVVFNNKVKNGSKDQEIQIKLLDFGTAYKITRPKVKISQLVGTLSYIPPQIIKGYFTEKCDLWSCGVILYILLTSHSPFKCKRKQETIDKILHHQLNFEEQYWGEVSLYAKDLVNRLLEKDPYKRISAGDALKHPWFQTTKQKVTVKGMDFVRNLTNYYRQNNLISVLESYLVFSKVSPEERKRVNQLFKQLDRNSDGVIQKNQLLQAYRQANSGQPNLDEVEYILNKIDKDMSGCINLNQFSSVMVNRQKLFAKQALDEAFDYFANGKGFIEMAALSKLLEGSNSKQIQNLLSELDEDQDRRISKEQFLNYLLKKGCLY